MTVKEKLILIKSRDDAERALKGNITDEQKSRLRKIIDAIEDELRKNPRSSKLIPDIYTEVRKCSMT